MSLQIPWRYLSRVAAGRRRLGPPGILCLASVAACAVGPDYHAPSAPLADAWEPTAPWQQAFPKDAQAKDRWWESFHDGALNALVEQALAANQDLRVASARLDQAHEQLKIARADLFPEVSLSVLADRGKDSANRPLAAYSTPNQATVQNDFKLGPAVSYELDLFGRVRRRVEGARATAQQAEADFQNERLMLTALLASDYFSLRELDAETEVVQHSLDLERDALTFVQSRHDLGFATGLDLAQQQALYDASGTQLELLQNQRVQLEHAIATLVGTPAPGFKLPAAPLAGLLPTPSVGLPADLLQRRPDVASAERDMAAANARIGVATAAYFPNIQLFPGLGTPAAGYESNALGNLFEAPSVLWSVGLAVSQTLFDAGKTRANVRYAKEDYNAAVATYRQTVLRAMEEVENGITGLAYLDRASTKADASVHSAQSAYDIASERYKGGVDTYLDVITAQQTLLTNQRQAVQIRGQQFATAVYLIKALGGGWQAPAHAAL